VRARLLLLLAVAAVALAAAAGALAHPLGNFTINRFSRLEVSGNRVYVLYVLDMAEIPTYQAREQGIDPNAYARRIAVNEQLTVNSRRVPLAAGAHALAFPPGVGGLRTTRLEVVLAGPRLHGRTRLGLHDANYAGRIGWKEIVVQGAHGGRVVTSSVSAKSESDELRAYPKDLLQSPLDVTSATATVEPGAGPGVAPALTTGKALEAPDRVADSGFTRLISRGRLSLLVILSSLAAALFWGAAHALSPGHGKTIVTAYLVGQRGTPWHAALLGAIVTVTHTIGVFAIGLVTLALSQFIVPDTLYPWLNLATGVLVVGIGASVFFARLRWGSDHGHSHAHGGEGHYHHHDHAGPSRRSLIAVGVSGGLLPCPSALVVLLAAISLHRIAFGLVLIVAFSMGLALSITGIGLVAVLARRTFSRVSFEGRIVRALPALSALVILVAGVAMTAHAVPKLR
jgi:ABC-type nickel/cobalt efflux system permease component RcnA